MNQASSGFGRNDGKPVRIVRVIARLNVGGASLHAVHLDSDLCPSRFPSLLVCGLENPGEGSMLDYAASHGVQPVVVPQIVGEATFRPRDVRALLELFRLMRRLKPLAVDTHTAKAGFVGRVAAWAARVPIVVHTYHGHVLSGYYGPLKSLALRMMERLLAVGTDRLLAVSEETKADLVRYRIAGPDKITVIDGGLDLGAFLNGEAVRGRLRSELGVAERFPLVGIAGRIFPIKNHRLFLEAAALAVRRLPDCRFAVVGDGVLREEMKALAADLGIGDRVFFTGWRRDMPHVFADLDLLVVSSDNEGKPFAAIEALASGVPVVATRVGGLQSLIRPGIHGYLVSPGDAEGLADAMARALGQGAPPIRLGIEERRKIARRYSVARLVRSVDAVFESEIKRRGLHSPSEPPGERPEASRQ